jgi:hypothetical protein
MRTVAQRLLAAALLALAQKVGSTDGDYLLFALTECFGDIEAEGTNKAVLIATARKVSKPATLIDDITGNILFENKDFKEELAKLFERSVKQEF